MFMMFHANEKRKPWLIGLFTLLLVIGAVVLAVTG